MTENFLKQKLRRIKDDLNAHDEQSKAEILQLSESYEERRRLAMCFFARDNSIVSISKTDDSGRAEIDMTKLMTDFSISFELYFNQLSRNYIIRERRRNEAMKIFKYILQLSYNECRALYFFYVKNYKGSECIDRMYISKSTFYRTKSDAITHLLQIINANEKDGDFNYGEM